MLLILLVIYFEKNKFTTYLTLPTQFLNVISVTELNYNENFLWEENREVYNYNHRVKEVTMWQKAIKETTNLL